MSEDFVFDFERVRVHGFGLYEGTALDVRAVIAGIPRDVRDGFRYEEVPWHRFSHAYGSGENVPEYLERMRSADAATADNALSSLWNSVCHQGTRCSVAPLTVPFLLRIAADRATHDRVNTLFLVAVAARRNYSDDGSRTGLLRVADADEDVRCDMSGHPQTWSVRAARDAIAADAHIPIALLDDPDPEVREAAAYVLAASSGRAWEISAALHERFRIEEVPRLRAGLILAIAQLAREHRHRRIHPRVLVGSRTPTGGQGRRRAGMAVPGRRPRTRRPARRSRRDRHARTRPPDGRGALDTAGRLRRRRTDTHPEPDVRPGRPPTPHV
ncbi:hypothetical protein [Embleya sp. NBC_00896]|uniref:hypothetical protein n=1 Tax=Embleya sp. NBC_00896 TaxID=2975961 RepID=UPI003868F217|nr:hypothetical protein OG928_32325 [Embleya sp. NBC_00896]